MSAIQAKQPGAGEIDETNGAVGADGKIPHRGKVKQVGVMLQRGGGLRPAGRGFLIQPLPGAAQGGGSPGR